MFSITNTQLSPPANWQDFERFCRDLWSKVWNDQNTQLNGRAGQPQNGVDVFGRLNGVGDWYAVQCKGRDGRYGGEVSDDELEEEVKKAKKFTHNLKEFILATTAKSNVNLQKKARELTELNEKVGLFSVHVYSWDDICITLQEYPEVIDSYYPGLGNSFQALHDKLDKILAHYDLGGLQENLVLEATKSDTLRGSQISTSFSLDLGQRKDIINIALQNEIDTYRDLIESSPKAAISAFVSLKEKHWKSSSDEIRFRIITNMGAAYLELGSYDEAAEMFLNAKIFAAEDNIKAIRNLSYAYLLKNDLISARENILKAIDIDSQDPDNHIIYISILAALGQDIIFEKVVPSSVSEQLGIIHAIAEAYYKQNKIQEAIKFAKKAYDIDSDSIHISSCYGNLLLETVIRGIAGKVDGFIDVQQVKVLEESDKILTNTWDKVKDKECNKKFVWIGVNLCTIAKLINDFERLNVLIDTIEAIGCDLPDFYRLAALCEYKKGDLDLCLRLLNKVDKSTRPDINLLRAQIYAELDQLDVSLGIVDSIKFAGYEDYERDARWFKVKLLYGIFGLSRALEEAIKNIDKYPTDPMSFNSLSSLYMKSGNKDLAREYAECSLKLLDQAKCQNDKLSIADNLYSLAMYKESYEIYRGYLKSFDDSFVLRRCILCLYNTDMRAELLDIFSHVPDQVRETSFYLFHLAAIYSRTGEYENSLKYLTIYLDRNQDDLALRINWINLNALVGNKDVILDFLKIDNDFSGASIVDQVHISVLLGYYGFEDRGRKLLYKLLRENPNDLDANLGYIYYMLKYKDIKLGQPTQIGENTAFNFVDESNIHYEFIVESEFKVKAYSEELLHGNPIIKTFIGKRVGESVSYAVNNYQSKKVVIKFIETKYRYIFRKKFQDFETSFPFNDKLNGINLNKIDGVYDLTPIVDILNKRHDFVKMAIELYGKNLIPICFFSKNLKESPFEIWNTFSLNKNVGIKCFGGLFDELIHARLLLANNDSGIIVDPFSLCLIFKVGIHEDITKAFGKIGIVQSCLDLYKTYVDSFISQCPSGSLFSAREKIRYVEYEEKDILKYIDFYSEVFEWARLNCNIIPSVGCKEISNDILELKDHLEDAFYDTLLAASGSGRILITDDLGFRSLAKQTLNVDGIWTQAVCMELLDKGFLVLNRYSKAVEKLYLYNIKHTVFDSLSLLEVVRNYDFVVNDVIERVFMFFEDEELNYFYKSTVGCRFIFLLMFTTNPFWIKKKYLMLILNKFINDKDSFSTTFELFYDLSKYFPDDIAEMYKSAMRNWLAGHFVSINIS